MIPLMCFFILSCFFISLIPDFFQRREVESQRQRGEEMDVMLTERDRKLAEKEAYIVHLQTALAGDQPITPAPQQKVKHIPECGVNIISPHFFNIFSHLEISTEEMTPEDAAFIRFSSTQCSHLTLISVCHAVNPLMTAQPCSTSSGDGGQRSDAGAAAAGAESDQEGGRIRGALQFAAGAGGQPQRAAGHREGAVQSEGEHVQTERRFSKLPLITDISVWGIKQRCFCCRIHLCLL